jgi:hypothetical protein
VCFECPEADLVEFLTWEREGREAIQRIVNPVGPVQDANMSTAVHRAGDN